MSRPYLQLLVIDLEHTKVHEGSFLYDLSAVFHDDRHTLMLLHHPEDVDKMAETFIH